MWQGQRVAGVTVVAKKTLRSSYRVIKYDRGGKKSVAVWGLPDLGVAGGGKKALRFRVFRHRVAGGGCFRVTARNKTMSASLLSFSAASHL